MTRVDDTRGRFDGERKLFLNGSGISVVWTRVQRM